MTDPVEPAPETAFRRFVELVPALRAAGFHFGLGGARALALHGCSRDTIDVDVFFTEQSRGVLTFLRDRGFRVSHFAADHFLAIPEGATSLSDHLDVFFPRVEPAQSGIGRAVDIDVDGTAVPVLPVASLVAAKLLASSSLQNGDAWLALDAGVVTAAAVAREIERVARLPANDDRYRARFEDVEGARHRLTLWKDTRSPR